MIVTPGNASHVGARQNQQDAFGFSDKDDAAFVDHGGVLAVVADGMGGLANGAQASQLAVRVMLEAYAAKQPGESIPAALKGALSQANDAVYRMAEQSEGEGNIGTTLVAAVAQEQMLYWVAVGDSRLYLWREGELTQFTTDHNVARELAQHVVSGRMSREEAQSHPERDALTSFLGLADLPDIDRNLRPFTLQRGDRLLLCSDGLYGTLSSEEVAVGLANDSAQQAADLLIQQTLSKQRTGQDNITAATLYVEPQRSPERASRSTVVTSPSPRGVPSGLAGAKPWVQKTLWGGALLLAVLLMIGIGYAVKGLWSAPENGQPPPVVDNAGTAPAPVQAPEPEQAPPSFQHLQYSEFPRVN